MFKYASVIVTFNRLDKLKEEINSLLSQKILPKKIIIIDNDSMLDTKEYCDSLVSSNSRIIYKRLRKNVGGSGGFYEGLKVSLKLDVDWISLSDDDAVYSKNFFEYIKNAVNNNKRVLCFTGTVTDCEGNIQLDHRRNIKNNIVLSQCNISSNKYKNSSYLQNISCVGVVLKKTLINDIGLPEKNYFIWCDDTEYSLRVIEHTKIMNVSNAIITHKTVNYKQTRFKPSWKMYYGIRNSIIMTKKHSQHKLLYSILLPLMILKKYLALFFKFNYYKPYTKKMAFIYFNGFKDGILKKTGINKNFLP
jgi:GT2 family glycosyltransferase